MQFCQILWCRAHHEIETDLKEQTQILISLRQYCITVYQQIEHLAIQSVFTYTI